MRASAGLPFLALLVLAACTKAHDGGGGGPADEAQPFDGIAQDEVLSFVGTEPFWGGTASGRRLTYTTPENPAGSTITVERFAGRGGLSFSGTLDGEAFDMMVTPGSCSDGMSDRRYPFVVTLHLGEEQREGCASSDRRPASDPPLG